MTSAKRAEQFLSLALACIRGRTLLLAKQETRKIEIEERSVSSVCPCQCTLTFHASTGRRVRRAAADPFEHGPTVPLLDQNYQNGPPDTYSQHVLMDDGLTESHGPMAEHVDVHGAV